MKRILTVIALILLFTQTAQAHPFSTRLWGHRLDATATGRAIAIDYTIEVPVTKLVLMMNRFKSMHTLERIGPEEERQFNEEMVDHLTKGISVAIDGNPVATAWNPNYARTYDNGEPGFYEYHLHLIAPLPEGNEPHRIAITNDNFRMQRAVFRNQAQGRDGVETTAISKPTETEWSEMDEHRTLTFSVAPGQGQTSPAHTTEADTEGVSADSTLVDYLKTREITARVFALALIAALLLGALHALSPGHGKALVAAYLVGSHGTVGHAMLLGLIVTLTHVASVIVLGLVGLFAAQYIVPEYYTPFVSLFSGALIVGIGLYLFVRRLIPRRHHHHHHQESSAPTLRQLLVLGISGGIVPCPTATVVMLTAIAIGRIGFGLALIAVFSVGLALVLIAIGILTVRARPFIDRLPKGELLTRWLPLASAIIVTLLGGAIIYQGFWREWTLLH